MQFRTVVEGVETKKLPREDKYLFNIRRNIILSPSIRTVCAAVVASIFVSHAAIAETTSRVDAVSQTVEIIPEADTTDQSQRNEFLCVALAVYHEAHDQPEDGQEAVAHAVINRTKTGRHPTTYCGVVYESWKGHPQFTWAKWATEKTVPRVKKSWEAAQRAAWKAMSGEDFTHGATHFYNPKHDHPAWARKYAGVYRSGGHVFCRIG